MLDERLRKLTIASLENKQLQSAEFYGNKLITISNQISDIFIYCKILYEMKEFKRCYSFLVNYQLIKSNVTNSNYIILAVNALMSMKEYDEADKLLTFYIGNDAIEDDTNKSEYINILNLEDEPINPLSILYNLKGKVSMKLNNRKTAIDWYKKSILIDEFCYDSYDSLIHEFLLTEKEQIILLKSILNKHKSSQTQSNNNDNNWLNNYYMRIEIEQNYNYFNNNNDNIKQLYHVLECDIFNNNLNTDLMLLKSELFYKIYNIQDAMDLINKIEKYDKYNTKLIKLKIGIYVYESNKLDLYKLCQELIDIDPENYLTNYSIGCYYYLIKDYTKCREFYCKCNLLNNEFPECWVSLGLLYSSQDESDQSINTYIEAHKLYPGNVNIIINLAIEYIKTNNLSLSEQYLLSVKDENVTNPLLWNELGVIYYRQNKYDQSQLCFLNVMKIVSKLPKRLLNNWECTIINLGHIYRIKEEYSKAIEYFEMGIKLNPKISSSYSALGLCYYLNGNNEKAIVNFHKCLMIDNDDPIGSELLQMCLDDDIQDISTLLLRGDNANNNNNNNNNNKKNDSMELNVSDISEITSESP